MIKRLSQIIHGFIHTMPFSNRWSLISLRLFSPSTPLLRYQWKDRWNLYCDPRVSDHAVGKALLVNGDYNECIRTSALLGSCSYVNVGAHIGCFDLAVASLGYKIPYALSIELNPRSYIKLGLNIMVNDLPGIKSINAGVAGRPGTWQFVPNKESQSDGIFNLNPSGALYGVAAVDIPLITLTEAITQSGLADKYFDLLKLDCESAEYDIIENTDDEVLKKFRNIVIELHEPPPGRSPERLYAKLASCGFHSSQVDWRAGSDIALRFWTLKS